MKSSAKDSRAALGSGETQLQSFIEADKLLASIAQDISDRWNEMVRANAIETLEACLFLTRSSCKVPNPLEPELKAKIINLSQYLQNAA
jgi:hypothetical protein